MKTKISNGFIEAIVAKMKNPKEVKIVIIPKDDTVFRYHIVWYDQADIHLYEFVPEKPIRKWYKWLLYRGHYRKISIINFSEVASEKTFRRIIGKKL